MDQQSNLQLVLLLLLATLCLMAVGQSVDKSRTDNSSRQEPQAALTRSAAHKQPAPHTPQPRASQAGVTRVTGTYIFNSEPGNFFDPDHLATLGTGPDQGVQYGVPTGYGNTGGFENVPVGDNIEFGWFNKGPAPELGGGGGGGGVIIVTPAPRVVSLDIAEVPEGYSITWTTDLGGVPPSSNDAATITLTSPAFEACTAISKVSDSTPGATGGLLSGSGVTLGTPDLGQSKQPYTVTWLLKCPPNCGEEGAACFQATARVWHTDAPWPDWVPSGAESEVLSTGTEKAWARVCKGSCSRNKCQVDEEQADKCFAQKDKPQ